MVRICNKLAKKNYVTSHGGNISYKLNQKDILITPTKVNKGDIKFEDIIVVNHEGGVKFSAGGRQPTGELKMHLGILNKRPDLRSLVHAHPPVLTGFSISSKLDILNKPYLPEPIFELGPIEMIDYAEPLSEDLLEAFEEVVHRADVFIMKNHGVMVACKDNVKRSFEKLEMLETTAFSVLIAILLGEPETLSKTDIDNLDKIIQKRNLPFPGAPGEINSLNEIY